QALALPRPEEHPVALGEPGGGRADQALLVGAAPVQRVVAQTAWRAWLRRPVAAIQVEGLLAIRIPALQQALEAVQVGQRAALRFQHRAGDPQCRLVGSELREVEGTG